MGEIETFTGWREERLYVLHQLDDLKVELRRLGDVIAVMRKQVEEKQVKDIQVAHDRIRKDSDRIKALETERRVMSDERITIGIKNWILIAALSIAGGFALELFKHWLGP